MMAFTVVANTITNVIAYVMANVMTNIVTNVLADVMVRQSMCSKHMHMWPNLRCIFFPNRIMTAMKQYSFPNFYFTQVLHQFVEARTFEKLLSVQFFNVKFLKG